MPLMGKSQCISSCNCVDKTTSAKIPVFCAFESSIKAFDNIFGNIFFPHEYGVIEISKFCTQTGSVQKRWKFPVAKRTELAL